MHAFWVILGIVVLGIAFLDVFLTALNYDESGFFATRLCELQWRCIRGVTRRLSRRWRPIALRQVTGLQIMLSAGTWIGCVIIGFGFIYYGLMVGMNFQYAGPGMGPSMFDAMYLSAAQLSTVGTSQIGAQTDMLRALTIAETLAAPVLITLSLTFLFGVYQVVGDLRTLSSNFSNTELEAGDLVVSLRPYFPNGQPNGLDGHLQAINDSFWSYADGLHLHHVAYYFQSGRDQFSLPYVLHMLGGTLAALRWGLPTGHPASVEPLLVRLSSQFDRFGDYLQGEIGWMSTDVPETASFEEFSAAGLDTGEPSNLWLNRFLLLTRNMAELVKVDAKENPRAVYERYRQWLPFAYRAEQMTVAVSQDLDYQPIFRSGAQAPEVFSRHANRSARANPLGVRTLMRSWRTLLNRWVAVPDPGLTRLTKAAGTALAVAATVGTLYLVFTVAGMSVAATAMFGGMVAMFSSSIANDASVAGRKRTTLLAVLPSIGAAALGGAVAPWFILSTAVLLAVVALAIWSGRFGSRYAALGQLGFMSFYFGLLLHFRIEQFPSIALAAAVGVMWAYLFRFILMPERPSKVLRSGLAAFHARLIMLFDPLIDAVSGARWDPDIRSRVAADMRQLHRCAAFLQGELRAIDLGVAGAQAGDLRLLLFDTELAVNNLTSVARRVAGTGTAARVVLRARLAGILVRGQDYLRGQDSYDESNSLASTRPNGNEPLGDETYSPQEWPEPARRLHDAIRELLRAATTLHQAQTTSLAMAGAAAVEPLADTGASASPPLVDPAPARTGAESSGQGLLAPTSRQAIQAAVATGLALVAGAAVTSAHQYWGALAAYLVLGGTETVEETYAKGMQRIVGTIAGAILGFGLTIVTGANPVAVFLLLIICIFAAWYVRPISNAQSVFWLTMMLSLLYEFLGTLTKETLQVRVLETVIGAAIAFGAAIFLLPIRTRQKVLGEGEAFLQTVDEITQSCIKRLAGDPVSAVFSAHALKLDGQFRSLTASAEPLRSSSGALRRDGVERLITASSALTYYVRHLITATEKFAATGAALPAAEQARLATFSRNNISALVQVLNKKLPGPVHESEDLRFQPDTPGCEPMDVHAEREAVHYIVRINQTVLAIIEDLTRDSAQRAQEATPVVLDGAPG